MKKVLLGTSAIALAGAFASQASAAEWTVRVGGYMEQYVAYSETDSDCCDGDFDGIENKSDSEVHFSPSITLDNGLTISARLELEGEQSSDQMDETYMRIQGSFGELRLGEDDLPAYNMSYAAPDVTFLNINSGSDTKFWGGTLLTTFTTTYPQVVTDPQHIAYYSPRIAGFQIGAGYARDGQRATVQSQLDQNFDSDTDTLSDVWAVGANYVNSFGNFNVAISGGYTEGRSDQEDADAKAWAVGANFGYAGFTIGGSYKRNDLDSVLDIDDDTSETPSNAVWDAGVSYETGPWGFSFTYLRYDDKVPGVDIDIDKYMIGVNYALAQGVRLNAFGVYADADQDEPGETNIDEEGWIIGTGIRIDF